MIGRFINADTADVLTVSATSITDKNLYAYCGNNPVGRKDSQGTAWETVFDVISLGASIADVAANPANVWAWAGLVGDIVDVAIPFIGGVGEVVKCCGAVNKADDVIDAAKQLRKSVSNSVGTYEITYKSGKNYVGKGTFDRAIQSAKRYANPHKLNGGKGDEVLSITWKKANNDKEAFITEFLWQSRDRKTLSAIDIDIFPSFDAKEDFDYSVLYKMPNLKSLYCKTSYGDGGRYKTIIDYSHISGLEELSMDTEGHVKFETVSTLKNMWISGNKKVRSFADVSCSPILQDVTFLGCGIQSLNGIENHKMMKSLTLWHNYSLKDISALAHVSNTLTELVIDACSKIKDFTVLDSLENVEFLSLDGNNVLPNLEFLKKMKKLKVFTFTMNVEDGDLSNCMEIPYVSCRNRKHYNLKNKELPKRQAF